MIRLRLSLFLSCEESEGSSRQNQQDADHDRNDAVCVTGFRKRIFQMTVVICFRISFRISVRCAFVICFRVSRIRVRCAFINSRRFQFFIGRDHLDRFCLSFFNFKRNRCFIQLVTVRSLRFDKLIASRCQSLRCELPVLVCSPDCRQTFCCCLRL